MYNIIGQLENQFLEIPFEQPNTMQSFKYLHLQIFQLS